MSHNSAHPAIPVLGQDHPILPPISFLGFVDRDLKLTPTALQFLQQLYATIAGDPGLISVVNLLAAGGVYDYHQPLAGDTLAATKGERRLVIDPAGLIATLTIIMPPEPNDQDFYDVMTSQEITLITVSPPATETVNGGSFLFAANTGVSWLYRGANKTWYRRY